jgi:hypothetical protein
MWIPVEGGPVVYVEHDGKPYQLEAGDGVLLPARQGDMFQEAKVAIEHYRKLFGDEGFCTIGFGKEGYAVVVSPQGPEAEKWRGGAKSVDKAWDKVEDEMEEDAGWPPHMRTNKR